MKIEQALASHIATTTADRLPAAAMAAAKRSLIDTFAVACGAVGAPGMQAVERVTSPDNRSGAVSIWHSAGKTSLGSAVFANGLASAALDYDSTYPDAAVHPDIVVVPVALGIGEAYRLSGAEVLSAIAVGGDVICRLARSTRANRGWFYTSVYGAIVAAAIAARLLKRREDVVTHAMGLGFLNASGTYQPVAERSLSKRTLAAFASVSGVLAGQLAAEGYEGPLEWLSGRYGLYEMYEAGDTTRVLEDLGNIYENTRISLKPYPSCQCNHAAIDALLTLREKHLLDASNVSDVEAIVSPYMDQLVGAPYEPGKAPQAAAQFSIRYSLARLILDGTIGIDEIRDAAALDPHAMALASKVRVTVDPANTGNYCPATVRVVLKDGSRFEQTTRVLRGSAEAPLLDRELRGKVTDCLRAGGFPRSEETAGHLFEALMNIDEEPNMADCMTKVMGMLHDQPRDAAA